MVVFLFNTKCNILTFIRKLCIFFFLERFQRISGVLLYVLQNVGFPHCIFTIYTHPAEMIPILTQKIKMQKNLPSRSRLFPNERCCTFEKGFRYKFLFHKIHPRVYPFYIYIHICATFAMYTFSFKLKMGI